MPKIKNRVSRIICSAAAVISVLSLMPVNSFASPITSRSVVIGNSAASNNTSYDFTFTATSGIIKSVRFQACDSASGTCTQSGSANGFSSQAPGATLNGQPTNLGSGGTWTVDNTDATSLRISNNSNTGSPSANSLVKFNNVHNPSATNSTFYIRITTYSDSSWTSVLDTGVIATSTAGQITVTASVNETLTFTMASNTVALGVLSSGSTASGTSSFSVGTNATTGYSVTYSGSTLTAGTDTITPMSARASSSLGSRQFGINLRNNATPDVGADKSGTGTGGVIATEYNTADQFKFSALGEEIASSAVPTNSNTFTVSYIANIDDLTPAGQYSTNIRFVATAKF